ncbi:MAG: hypothetical protein R2728_06590 [Chitinophagales bacterium]
MVDLDVTVTDGSLCVEIINDVDGFQADQICVVHCDALGNDNNYHCNTRATSTTNRYYLCANRSKTV